MNPTVTQVETAKRALASCKSSKKLAERKRTQFSSNKGRAKGTAVRAHTWACHPKIRDKAKRSQSMHYKKGPLSGHWPSGNRRKNRPKRKKSVLKQKCASTRDSWAGTYKLSIVEKLGQNERSQLTNKKVRAKRTADSQFSNGTSLPPRLEQAQLLLH